MNKENATAAKFEEPTARITRARAKALGTLGGIVPASKPSYKRDQKRVLVTNTKRAALDENKASGTAVAGLQHKRRAVLKDVTNILDESSYVNCVNATKVQLRTGRQAKRCPAKEKAGVSVNMSMEIPHVVEDAKTKLAEELSKIRMVESREILLHGKSEEKSQRTCHGSQDGETDLMLPLLASRKSTGFQQFKEEGKTCEKLEDSSQLGIVNIDSNLKDPQVCSIYAPEIYDIIRVKELDQRPSSDYMERLQSDITPGMREILIDWLVEVSEEYKLVPDTLYLAVNLIDRFLSHNYIKKQRLQLLGVTCMLIASKYEEICAPRVEEFCFITDNTYTRGEVLTMESSVLNFLCFQLSVPTTKTFLRRFIQAAQASSKAPCVELEFLANFIAELTLLEYDFLKFPPSLIAASAVFLARWALNQSDHPWNPTLEHYTSYNASELKTTVLELENLQLNTNGCLSNAIREKYGQQKFKCVATMASPPRVLTFFQC